jgi:flagellar protein FlaG
MSIETSGLPPQTPVQNTNSSSRQLPEIDQSQAASAEQSGSAVTAEQQASLSVENLQAAVEKMNELMQNGQRSLNFSVDDSTEKVVVKVMDTDTKEVVRQIPSEETLKFAEYLEGMVGLIFDDKA